MSNKTEEIALARIGMAQPTAAQSAEAARIQREIGRTMREVIARPYNPNQLNPPQRVSVGGAGRVIDADTPSTPSTGWAEPKPLTLPPGQDIIERLVNAALGPGSKRNE